MEEPKKSKVRRIIVKNVGRDRRTEEEKELKERSVGTVLEPKSILKKVEDEPKPIVEEKKVDFVIPDEADLIEDKDEEYEFDEGEIEKIIDKRLEKKQQDKKEKLKKVLDEEIENKRKAKPLKVVKDEPIQKETKIDKEDATNEYLGVFGGILTTLGAVFATQ